MRGAALYPGKDLWAAVGGRDWVQVGNDPHPPGTSHVNDLGEYPEHFDEGNESCTEVLLWIPMPQVATPVVAGVQPQMPPMAQPVMAYASGLPPQAMHCAQPYMQQPGMQPQMMMVAQPGMQQQQQPMMMMQPGMQPQMMAQPGMQQQPMMMMQPGMQPPMY